MKDSAIEVINLRACLHLAEERTGMLRENDQQTYIYLLKLIPDGRFKVGLSGSWKGLENRLVEAKRWVPEAEMVKAWPGKQGWEALARFVMQSHLSVPSAIAAFALTSRGQNSAGMEVIYDCERDVLIHRADELFDYLEGIEDNESTK